MYLQILRNIKAVHGFRDADLARLAHVSRAAVSKWFREGEKKGWVNVETKTLFELGKSLKIEPAIFLQKHGLLSRYKTEFLWDNLYPDMESFLKSVCEGGLPALARFVQVLGFSESKKILGEKVVTQFKNYKKYLKPAKLRELEILWPLYH